MNLPSWVVDDDKGRQSNIIERARSWEMKGRTIAWYFINIGSTYGPNLFENS
jgi:hypothetical protein